MSEKWIRPDELEKYEVSSEGRVRNSKTGRILKTSTDRDGNTIVDLHIDGQKHTKKMHRLVAAAHMDCDLERSYIEHIDGNKQNNKLSNLEVKPKGKRIKVIETGEIYDSISECSRALGMSISTISKCSNYSFYNNQYGYHFEVID